MIDRESLSSLPRAGEAIKPRPTMRDVAALAGVGLKTVSRVINDEPGVSEETAARVRRAVDQLDYLPNLTASNLRRSSGKTSTIGLLLENVANPFSSALHRAVEDVARIRGTEVFAGSVDEVAERERSLAATFAARRVDGLIIMPASHDHSYLLNNRRSGMAFVFVDRPPEFFDADAVLCDNRAGAAEGVRHLLLQGHRRIAYLGDLESIWTAQGRYSGYLDAHRSVNAPVNPALIARNLHTADAAETATIELLDQPRPPTAIFASQNLLTVGAVRALRSAGLQRTVAVVGFDDFMLADLLDPPITVVAQDPATMGTLAATYLFARLDGDASPPTRHVVPTTLIVRGSGEIRPADS